MQQDVIDGFRFSTPTTVAQEQVEALDCTLARLRRLLAHALPQEGAEIILAVKSAEPLELRLADQTYGATASFAKN